MAGLSDCLVERALRSAASDIVRVDEGFWQFSLANGSLVPARARIADGWFELTTALPRSLFPEPVAEQWLRLNACLDGPVRAAFAPRSRTVQLRADLSVDDEAGLDARVRSACEEVRTALHLLESHHEAIDRGAPNDSLAGEIEGLCAEAGWPISSRGTGGLRLDLDTRAGIFSARFKPADADTGRWVVELTDLATCSIASREAIAAFLLSLSGAVRSVKSVLEEREDALMGAVVSVVEHPVVSHTLDRSLSALVVACQMAGREVQALRDERVAVEYLALWSAGRDTVWPASAGPEVRLKADATKTNEEEHTCLQQL